MSETGRWALAEAVFRNQRAGLWTTRPELVDEVLLKLQDIIPSARIAGSDSGSERFGVRLVTFDQMQGLDLVAQHGIVAILCELGWEPRGQFEFRRFYPSDGPETHEPG